MCISKSRNQARGIHLIGSVRHDEGELVGVLLLLAGVEVLDAAGHQVGLRECADSGACRRANRSFWFPSPATEKRNEPPPPPLFHFQAFSKHNLTLSQR